MSRWYVFTMDAGLLGVYRTRREALAHHGHGTPVLHRRQHDELYEYVLGYRGEGQAKTLWITSSEPCAVANGFEIGAR